MAIVRDFREEENKVIKETTSKHTLEISLFADLFNLFINGFNLIGSLSKTESETHQLWLYLLIRSFHSFRCSSLLMQKGYYAQSISLTRMVTEAYFLCGNAAKNTTIAEKILRGKSVPKFNYRVFAENMGALGLYDDIYGFECDFSHFSNRSAGILTIEIEEKVDEVLVVPRYNEIQFISCCEVIFRNCMLMGSFLEQLIGELSEANALTLKNKSANTVKEIIGWLDNLEKKYAKPQQVNEENS